jgi:transcriptional regulatory protein RtcR
VFRSSPIAFSITAVDEGRFLDVNEAFERRYGYARKELLGRTVFDLGIWDLSERMRNKEARQHFLEFALSSVAKWTGNFRDLNAAVVRMATLAQGRISVEIVQEEIARLSVSWVRPAAGETDGMLAQLLSEKSLDEFDLFDRVQLTHVLQVCRDARSMSDAGRQLFGASRTRKTSSNDADRLRKHLNRFGIQWDQIIQPSS